MDETTLEFSVSNSVSSLRYSTLPSAGLKSLPTIDVAKQKRVHLAPHMSTNKLRWIIISTLTFCHSKVSTVTVGEILSCKLIKTKMTVHDGIKKPLPPPGLPTIAQRAKALQLAARSHSTEQGKKVRSPGNGAVEILFPPRAPQAGSNSKIPETIVFKVPLDDEGETEQRHHDIKKSSRPRFMRGTMKTNHMYPTKDDLDVKKP